MHFQIVLSWSDKIAFITLIFHSVVFWNLVRLKTACLVCYVVTMAVSISHTLMDMQTTLITWLSNSRVYYKNVSFEVSTGRGFTFTLITKENFYWSTGGFRFLDFLLVPVIEVLLVGLIIRNTNFSRGFIIIMLKIRNLWCEARFC